MDTDNELNNSNVVTPSSSMDAIKRDLSSISKTTPDSMARSIQNSIPANSPQKSTIWSLFKYGFIIIILAFLGINLFSYLGIATDKITSIFKPVLSFFGYAVGDTVKQTSDVTAEGVKAATDITANTVDTGVDIIQDSLSKNSNSTYDNEQENTNDALNNDNLDEKEKQIKGAEKALDETIDTLDKKEKKLEYTPAPIETTSVGQTNLKSGYCLIGDVNGTRTCLKVGENDTCMSNKIYPSLEICRDPNLRQ